MGHHFKKRCNGVMEAVEPRRMLAFAAVDYFPGSFYTAHYAGTLNGAAATAEVKSASAGLGGGEREYDIDTHIVSGLTAVASNSDYWLSAWGLGVMEVEGYSDGTRTIIRLDDPFGIVRPTFNVGDKFDNPSIPAQLSISPKKGGTAYGAGSVTGSTTVLDGLDRVDLPDGRHFLALRIEMKMESVFSGKAGDGSTWWLSGSETTTLSLARGIGVVRQVSHATTSFAANGSTENQAVDISFSLTDSTLLDEHDFAFLSDGVLTVDGTAGDDIIAVTANGGGATVVVGDLVEEFATGVSIVNLFGHDGNDRITFTSTDGGAYIDAGAGNDAITAGDGPDTLTGGAGKDLVDGGVGNDRVAGNGGHDYLIGGVGDDRLYGGNQNDHMEGGGGVDRLWGGENEDFLVGGGSNDKLFGESGNDTLYGGNHSDLLIGGAGLDQLFGLAGADSLNGLDGEADLLDGGDGDDTADADAIDQRVSI